MPAKVPAYRNRVLDCAEVVRVRPSESLVIWTMSQVPRFAAREAFDIFFVAFAEMR
jgi:hypothetical protein